MGPVRASSLAVLVSLAAPAVAFGQSGSFTVYNQSSWSVHRLYISPTSVTEWGVDQLGTEVISTGGDSYTLTNIPCNSYDMKIVDEDGDSCVMNNIRMCGGTASYTITSDSLLACIAGNTAAPAPAYTPPAPSYAPIAPSIPSASVTVRNSSSWSIHYLYMSPSSVDSWGSDRLGSGTTIPSGGGTYTLYGIACDTWDAKLVDEDGDECVIKGIRLCGENQTWSITNDNLLACQAGN